MGLNKLGVVCVFGGITAVLEFCVYNVYFGGSVWKGWCFVGLNRLETIRRVFMVLWLSVLELCVRNEYFDSSARERLCFVG